MTSATQRILDQHRDFAKVLKALEAIAEGPLEKRNDEDMARLYDICHYVRVFPDKLHHPDEERFVFGPLRAAAPDLAPRLDEIQDQHERCESLTTRLHETIQAFDRGECEVAALRVAIDEYLGFQFEHMRREERDILPLVDELLDENQRSAASSAFARHADPLFDENLAAGFEALRRRILGRA